MAKVGEQLLAPEAGWKRIDDTNEKFSYLGFNARTNVADYNETSHIIQSAEATVNFIFYSSRIRIIGGQGNIFGTATIVIDNDEYQTINNIDFTDNYQTIIFEKTNLMKTAHHISLKTNNSNYFIFYCIDIDYDGYLLTEEEYNQSSYIKQDNKYYGFSDDNYDTTTKMYKEVTLDNIKNLKYNNLILNLTKETTIGDETFKPIDKFTNFQLISPYNNKPKTVIGSKSKSGLIVANGDIYAGKISDRINSFTLDYTVNNNSAIKMAVSFDNGSTWKTYKDGAFQELSITIPNKYYVNMTDEEKTNYSNAKTTILESGFNASDLSSIDFNIDNLDTIRFAYVLYQDSINDDCKMSDLSWNFNAKGYLQKMKDSEVDTSFCNGIIKITPLIDCEMIITNYNY